MMVCAVILDNTLRYFGIEIHPWKEAVFSGLAGIFFSSLFVPVLWKLGLITVPQYILGALGVFVPATLISLAVIYHFHPIIIDIAGLDFDSTDDSKAWAISIYIRILRSAVLFPIYIFAFWLIYHKYLGNKHL